MKNASIYFYLTNLTQIISSFSICNSYSQKKAGENPYIFAKKCVLGKIHKAKLKKKKKSPKRGYLI